MAHLARRGPVPDVGAERGGNHHIAPHHHRSGHHHTQRLTHEVHAKQAQQHDQRRREHEHQLPQLIDEPAGNHADHRSQNQHHPQNQGVVRNTQVVLDINDQIGEKHLHRNREQAEGGKGQVQLRVLLHHAGPQPVEQIFEIAVLPGLQPLVIPEQAQGKQAHHRHRKAENAEKFLPSPLLGQAVKQAEDQQHGNQRQDGQHALHPSPVSLVGHIGDIGVEGGVIGGAAEEGHHAVQHHHQDGGGRHGVGAGEQPCGVFRRDKAEKPGAHAPEQIAQGNKGLPPAQPVRQCPHQQGGHGCHHRRPGHHAGDIARVGGNGVIQEHVEIHVLNGPGQLSGQADQNDSQPLPGAQCLAHILSPSGGFISLSPG